ncbi:MAG: AAA domain-containing protein [Chloroflexota bacterium]|nr:AAA domain-containing protein [Chloroflexota bacterium]
MGEAANGGKPGGVDAHAYPVAVDARGERPISPTDVSQFVRLDQCRRYLRLRLHERAAGRRFLYDYGVAPQAIPPLLSRSGLEFERAVGDAVRARYRAVDLAAGVDPAHRGNDNERVAALARDLPPGETLVVLQPRLEVAVEGWRLRGDADLLRLERDVSGELSALIADVKSSAAAKVEHRLQVAFYHEMLAALLAAEAVPCAAIETAILYRGAAATAAPTADPKEAAREADERDAAFRLFNAPDVRLELVEDAEGYRESVRDLVTGSGSVAARVAAAPFAEVPYHLTYKCDGCLYTEFCTKWSAEHDDLSLLPHLSDRDKNALHAAGPTRVAEVAHLKEPRPNGDPPDPKELVPAPGKEELVRRLGATWPVGPRLDEIVHRARRYRDWMGDKLPSLPYIPSKGYGSLPYSDAGHNPNLIRVYLDAQHDHLHDRVYLLGSLVVASEGGAEPPHRRRTVVHLADGPPVTAEAEAGLFTRWVSDTIRAIVELAAPDEDGEPRAPIHLIFFDRFDQRRLLEGLGRHAGTVLGATPLYDFVTQLAAFDSPVATFLDEEIRELKNYPMVCQSLQAVAAFLKFDWNEGTPYRELFRHRLFDFWGKREEDGAPPKENPWYTSRARFSSQVPLEYAYAAWGELPPPPANERDDSAPYRRATPELLRGFQARRLAALEHVARNFQGNKQTEKHSFVLPDLARFKETARDLAQALDEFVTIERHVALAAWKRARLAPPERRVVAGDTLLVRYEEAGQEPDVAEQNRENERRRLLREEQRSVWRDANPDAARVVLPKDQAAESGWSQEGLAVKLRFDLEGVDADLDEVLALSRLRPGDAVVVYPRWTTDGRLPPAERVPFQPTPRQMLYGTRATLVAIRTEHDESGRARSAVAELALAQERGGDKRGFAFAPKPRPLVPGGLYTLDEDPNDWYGSWQAKVTEGLVAGERNTLHARLADPTAAHAAWPAVAAAGQARFLAGLAALGRAGALHGFEQSKQTYIGEHGDAPILLVQGPPGTGKSYSTAFALFARLQGAMAAGLDHRAVLSCKTHAATDVLLDNVLDVRAKLAALRASQPTIWSEFFDDRLLDVPLFRVKPRGDVPEGVVALPERKDGPPGAPKIADALAAERWCVAAATPGGVYKAVKERWPKALFGHDLVDCLVLDEASQMNLPEAAMAALLLKPDGRLVVVGDHRQMPPIVKHDWDNEARRTFRAYRTYESLFTTLLPMGFPIVRFAESFRLHADIAAFLKREVYRRDGIDYHSNRFDLLPAHDHGDAFVDAVLAPAHPLTVVVHDETTSQHRNPVERALIAPVLDALAARGFDAVDGLGVVVPHRAQRALLQEAVPALVERDPATGAIVRSAVDTVERFQGGERTVVLVGATESDPAYLLAAGEFLLDPRRLTVALSRAKRKMVLVAARSVFDLFSADEETFQNARLWKNLLRQTCTVPLWQGDLAGARVEVWANPGNGQPDG